MELLTKNLSITVVVALIVNQKTVEIIKDVYIENYFPILDIPPPFHYEPRGT